MRLNILKKFKSSDLNPKSNNTQLPTRRTRSWEVGEPGPLTMISFLVILGFVYIVIPGIVLHYATRLFPELIFIGILAFPVVMLIKLNDSPFKKYLQRDLYYFPLYLFFLFGAIMPASSLSYDIPYRGVFAVVMFVCWCFAGLCVFGAATSLKDITSEDFYFALPDADIQKYQEAFNEFTSKECASDGDYYDRLAMFAKEKEVNGLIPLYVISLVQQHVFLTQWQSKKDDWVKFIVSGEVERERDYQDIQANGIYRVLPSIQDNFFPSSLPLYLRLLHRMEKIHKKVCYVLVGW